MPPPDPRPLAVGPFTVRTPVVLAPMAGVTNQAFRRLCREAMAEAGGEGLFVSEMVTSRALLERNAESLRLIQHDADEHPRSVQVYGVDPAVVGAAVRMLVEEGRADHIDLNFGCPVPKVTRKGGGAALPWKWQLFEAIVQAAVRQAAPHGVPVTVKMRKGIDPDHLSYLDAGKIAEASGAATVALHGRTAADYYSGQADWDAIATLKQTVTSIPVLGNGDIWSGDDAVRMMRETGCDGVVVGRGCLGRPWLFADLAHAMAGRPDRVRPRLRDVVATMRRHLDLLEAHFAAVDDAKYGPANAEDRACREIRKHIAWYFKGYPVGHEVRVGLAQVTSKAEFDDLAGKLDLDTPYPGEAAEGPRGRAGSPRGVNLPEGWLADRFLDDDALATLAAAELSVSGG
ncbi:tRNA dihydrouridine synthase DusB [Spongisporangium articulatum]|uniref:tRNA dihydrouridine synthase DusB n=1 Tax=Spongisporangium articulatum TaxID=3362603 RepID=A0ABW8ALC1_9ACTN